MIQELAWYIESGRFTGIVEEIEEKASSYAALLAAKSKDADERGKEFLTLCRWHMKKSGWRADEAETMDIEAEFFDGAEVKREALNRFEKEVIKAHMYQKHLWEFMGTTGSMTVISKSAMTQDGYDYNAYLPIERRRNMPPKSPLSRLMKEHPSAVPIYQYLDGSVSTEYDSERAAARFDILKDRSGFDWSSEGWDPNYEVKKNGWHGEYSPNGIWTLVHENEPTTQDTLRSTAKFTPPLELIRDGDGAILYDPGRSLLSLALRVWLLEDGSVYGAEKTDIRKTTELIRSALGRMEVKSITAVCAGTRKQGSARMMVAYRAALGELISPDARSKTAAEAEESRRKFHAEIQAEETTIAGRQLFRAMVAAVKSGAKGADAVQSVRSKTVRIPLSLYDEGDRTTLGLTEVDINQILSYDVPEEKRAAFSTTVLGLLKEERLLATGGISRSDIIGMTHAYAVHGKTPEETVSVETTLAQLCSDPDINLGCDEAIEEATLAQLEEASKSIPQQANAETQRTVNAAVKSAMRNFAAIRMSTGMTPKEAVEAAVRIAGGKTGKPLSIPQGKIEYVAQGTSATDDGKRRIFSDIALERLVQAAAGQPPQTKEADIQTVMTQGEESGDGKAYNLLSAEERGAWYESEQFKESGLSVEQVELLAEEETERLAQVRRSEETATISWETELDERYGLTRRQNLDRTASMQIVPPTTRVSAEEATKQLNSKIEGKDTAKKTGGRTYNMLSEEERTRFYKTAAFKESGLTEKDADNLITAYAGQERASTAARVLLLDALLFSKTMRRARKDKRSVPPEEIMAAAITQEPAGRTYNLLSKKERKEFYRSEEFKGSDIREETAEAVILEHTKPSPVGTEMNGRLAIDAAAFARAASEAREKGVQTAAQIVRKALEQAVVEEYEEAVEPFKAWRPQPDSTSIPKPVAAVRAEDAVQARKSLLARKDAKRNEEQERGSRDSIPQTRQNAEAAENSLAAADKILEWAENPSQGLTTERQSTRKSFQDDLQDIETSRNSLPEFSGTLERTESPSRRMMERQSEQKVVNNDQQDAGTYENSFFDAGETPEHVEIPSRHQLTEHQNTQERHYSDRQNTVASGNSFPKTDRATELPKVPIPEPDGITEYAGIPPRQPTERQNTLEFPSQNWQVSETQVNPCFQIHQVAETHVNSSSQTQQVAETYRNSSPRTQQNTEMNGNNPVVEKKTGAPAGNHDTITVAQHGHDEQTTQNTEARRMEKLNAAYEHDRAALAKTDPAFTRSTFRDVGHAEGSEETDGYELRRMASKMTEVKKERIKDLKRMYD